MRPLVLGRKNWIHIGSQQAGPRVAAILSIVRMRIPEEGERDSGVNVKSVPG
jgi:hypothetical protein